MKQVIFLLVSTLWSLSLTAQTPGPKIGGRFFLDLSTFQADDSLDIYFPDQAAGGVEFRTVSLHFKGAATENMDYKVQVALQGGKIRFQDVYLKIKNLAGIGGNLWLGHFPEPLTISSSVSSNYTVFMERNPVSGYMPRRNTGLMYEQTAFNNHIAWQLAAFFDADPSTGNALVKDQNIHYNARLTGMLMQDEEHNRYFMLGAAYSRRHPTDGNYLYRPTQSSHLEPHFISGQGTQVESVSLPTAQLMLITGPFSLQGEYVHGRIFYKNTTPLTEIPSYYAFASFFLTGEHRHFKGSYGGFGRVKINKPFSPQKKQWGAWEIAARMGYSHIKDPATPLTYLREYTLGLNWYLNSHTRMMFNYVRSDVNGQGFENAGMMRVQVNF